MTDCLPLCRLASIATLERLLLDLSKTSDGFTTFWSRHQQRLDQCLQLRKFEEQFKNLQFSCERHLTALSEMTSVDVTLDKANDQLSGLRSFESLSKDDIKCAQQLNERGAEFINADHYAVDCIQPKCDELERISSEYWKMFNEREERLEKMVDLQTRIDKANRWCPRGVDLLAGQDVEHINTVPLAQKAVKEIEDFIREVDGLNFDDPSQFRSQFVDILDDRVKQTVNEVMVRHDDVMQMCVKRRQRLRSLVDELNPESSVQLKQATVISRSQINVNSGLGEHELRNGDSKKWRLPFSSKNHSTKKKKVPTATLR